MARRTSIQNMQRPKASWRHLFLEMSLVFLAFGLGVVAVMPGCSSPRAGRLAASAGSVAEFDAGFTLLHELLASEAQVDGILILKTASPKTEQLLKEIANASVEMRDELDEMSSQDPTLTREASGLPLIESSARDAIESDTTMALLGAGEEDFDVRILLTQEKAMSYGTHLARSLSASDSNPERADRFGVMASRMSSFHDRALALLIERCLELSVLEDAIVVNVHS